ncbi:MAG: M23 family metallopeptidase [Prochloraceae cyanobacterium]
MNLFDGLLCAGIFTATVGSILGIYFLSPEPTFKFFEESSDLTLSPNKKESLKSIDRYPPIPPPGAVSISDFDEVVNYESSIGGYSAKGDVQIYSTQQKSSRSPASKAWKSASFPVENFQAYTSKFGYRTNPVTGKRQFHPGLDLAAPIGSNIRAWWGGYIVGLSGDSACGTSVIIKSGSWTHIYCHLHGYIQRYQGNTYLVDRQGGITLKLGQAVGTGMRIGRVGMSGRTTGPHLHWGLKYNDRYVNPSSVLEQMY